MKNPLKILNHLNNLNFPYSLKDNIEFLKFLSRLKAGETRFPDLKSN